MVAAETRMLAEAIGVILQDRGFEVIGVETMAGGAAAATNARPDVVVVDLEPAVGSRTALRGIVESAPDARVIGMAAVGADMSRHALPAGIDGCVTKDVGADGLVDAIRAVVGGENVAASRSARRVRTSLDDDREAFLIGQLTPRELEVLRMVAAAVSNEDIAARLSISANTVRSHVQSIFAKLQVHSRLEAGVCAARNGLLPEGGVPPPPGDVTSDGLGGEASAS